MDAARLDEIDMSSDHELYRDILAEYNLSPKWLAMKIGKHLSSIYRYGEDTGPTIPSLVWRVLFEKTEDIRLTQLVTGDVPVVIVDLADRRTEYERHDAPTLKQLIRVRRRHLDCEQNILDMLADGKIDKKDAAAFAAYQRNHPAAMQSAHKLFMQIKDEFERSRKS